MGQEIMKKGKPVKLHKISVMHETITALKTIGTAECSEHMEDLRGNKRIFFSEKCVKREKGTFCRKKVKQMLVKALNLLPHHCGIIVTSAYRSIKEQEKNWNEIHRKLRKKHPEWPDNILARETNKFCFPVGKGVPPYHSTGGAIDAYLCDSKGKMLKAWDTDRFRESKYHHPGLSEEAKRNREILRRAMLKAGFTNYPLEFWHFSYGDSGWALRTGRKTAIYGRVEEDYFQ